MTRHHRGPIGGPLDDLSPELRERLTDLQAREYVRKQASDRIKRGLSKTPEEARQKLRNRQERGGRRNAS